LGGTGHGIISQQYRSDPGDLGFPFFVINLAMGLTPIKTFVFYLVSQVGMLPGTFVFVNAGTQIGKLESLKGILSPELIISFALLGIFPLAAKKIISMVKARRAGKPFAATNTSDYNPEPTNH
jgi:hypothetical protein